MLLQAHMVRMARLCERSPSKGKLPTERLLQEAVASLEAAVAGVVDHHSVRCLVSVDTCGLVSAATCGKDSQLGHGVNTWR